MGMIFYIIFCFVFCKNPVKLESKFEQQNCNEYVSFYGERKREREREQ